MSSAIELASDLNKLAGKPAYIEFSTIAKHLPKRSEEEGRYVAVDIDMVTVRQIGAADSCVFKVESWLQQNKVDAANKRIPFEHADYYERAYQRWKSGQEIPVDGTPIKGWPVISPAQTALLVSIGIRTVEELAAINDEVVRRVGIGAVTLKNKAQAWLDQAKDKGPLTMEMAKLKDENALLHMNLAKLTEQVEALQEQVKAAQPVNRKATFEKTDGISADDILGDEEPPARKGKAKKEA